MSKPTTGGKRMIVEKTIRFEVTEKDLEGTYTWDEAKDQEKDGWKLPNKEELNLMYEQRETIGGFSSSWYWSSSDFFLNSAWAQDFTAGDKLYGGKGFFSGRVRFIRDVQEESDD